MKGSETIEERAAHWLCLRESGHWGEQEQARLDAWLQEATANRIAYLRLEAGWEQANRLKALGAGFPRGKVPTIEALEGVQRSGLAPATAALPMPSGADGRASSRLAAAAAAVVLTLGAGIYLYSMDLLRQERYSTTIGAVTSVPLTDGTNVTLNTASRMRVELTDSLRKVELARGEAFFDVARDATRPFVVHVGDRMITVLGTRFSVRRESEDIRVIVTEGKVAVSSGAVPDTGDVILTAGDSARVTSSHIAVEKSRVAEVEEALSWRSGYLVFRETTLADAVAEFNRYNERKIVIADPAVSAIRLTGKFRATNCETFIRLLQDSFPIQARRSEDQIVLTQR